TAQRRPGEHCARWEISTSTVFPRRARPHSRFSRPRGSNAANIRRRFSKSTWRWHRDRHADDHRRRRRSDRGRRCGAGRGRARPPPPRARSEGRARESRRRGTLRRCAARPRTRRAGARGRCAGDDVRHASIRGRVDRGTALSTGRRAARRSALFALYKWDLTGKVELEAEADEYARRTVEEVRDRAASLDTRITESAEGWTADRL